MNRQSVRTVLFAFFMLVMSAASFGQVSIAVRFGPPALPVYAQPLCPGEGYIWTPGYWAWSEEADDYFWVPGTWVLAPEPGFLWTPPYWGWGNGGYVFYRGYWGPHIGFYGGINYGFGYFGEGFAGGRWEGNRFFYNRSVTNINVTNIHNVYNTTVINQNTTVNRVSYNGGNGGINARPTAEQEVAARERHIDAVEAQTQHVQAARGNPQFRAASNQGRPPVAATERPGQFNGHGVERAREAGAPYNRPAANDRPASNRPQGGGNRAMHASDMRPFQRPPAPNTGNDKVDRKYQQQQDRLQQKQDQERQKLQERQDRDDQQLERRNADDARRQQFEQRHEQQTQQLQQRHEQQQQRLQQRQAPPSRKESNSRKEK